MIRSGFIIRFRTFILDLHYGFTSCVQTNIFYFIRMPKKACIELYV